MFINKTIKYYRLIGIQHFNYFIIYFSGDFVKLAEAYGCVGLRAKTPEELDDKIIEMLNTDQPVIFDCLVDKQENCFPMIPSGKPHNQMLLGPKDQKNKKITGKGRTLV